MAGFCRYWRIPPSEYYKLTVSELDAMFEYMADERKARKREADQQAAAARRKRR